MYAIIATGGKQYRVEPGKKVRVEKLEAEVGSKVTFDTVLMVSADGATIGNPYVDGAVVEGEVTEQGRSKKVIVYKYKPKKTYHKKNGHRQFFTEILVEKIVCGGVTFEAEEAPEETAEEVTEEVTEETVEETVEEAAEETAEETAEEAEAEDTQEAAE